MDVRRVQDGSTQVAPKQPETLMQRVLDYVKQIFHLMDAGMGKEWLSSEVVRLSHVIEPKTEDLDEQLRASESLGLLKRLIKEHSIGELQALDIKQEEIDLAMYAGIKRGMIGAEEIARWNAVADDGKFFARWNLEQAQWKVAHAQYATSQAASHLEAIEEKIAKTGIEAQLSGADAKRLAEVGRAVLLERHYELECLGEQPAEPVEPSKPQGTLVIDWTRYKRDMDRYEAAKARFDDYDATRAKELATQMANIEQEVARLEAYASLAAPRDAAARDLRDKRRGLVGRIAERNVYLKKVVNPQMRPAGAT